MKKFFSVIAMFFALSAFSADSEKEGMSAVNSTVQSFCYQNDIPSGWVVTGRGLSTCGGGSIGIGRWDTYRAQPAQDGLWFCENGPNPPANYYIVDSNTDRSICGNNFNVIYTRSKMKKSGASNITVCRGKLPNHYQNLSKPSSERPREDYVITGYGSSTCYKPTFDVSVYPAYAKRLRVTLSNGAEKLSMRVCSKSPIPPYAQRINGSAQRDYDCDVGPYDNSGSSVLIEVDPEKVCRTGSPYYRYREGPCYTVKPPRPGWPVPWPTPVPGVPL